VKPDTITILLALAASARRADRRDDESAIIDAVLALTAGASGTHAERRAEIEGMLARLASGADWNSSRPDVQALPN